MGKTSLNCLWVINSFTEPYGARTEDPFGLEHFMCLALLIEHKLNRIPLCKPKLIFFDAIAVAWRYLCSLFEILKDKIITF
ncbi:hypothetical protein BpHYR1_023101 [Brachionus plicatilis]|uniref:Uncharacterized protein n=1 Tax=Brachionus plicatilis TaxID=10195 RepID=A0A3M7T2T2_BRAPC|nr:hypothetical protein BpHYR1_023101 [Brachionus plicatilis]